MTPLLDVISGTLDAADLGPVPITAAISWTPVKPAELVFDFRTADLEDAGTTWAVSRDLVLKALRSEGEHGDLDVMVGALGTEFLMVLRGSDLEAGIIAPIRLPRGSVAWIVDRSVEMIAPGSQAEIAAILGDIDAELLALCGGAE